MAVSKVGDSTVTKKYNNEAALIFFSLNYNYALIMVIKAFNLVGNQNLVSIVFICKDIMETIFFFVIIIKESCYKIFETILL